MKLAASTRIRLAAKQNAHRTALVLALLTHWHCKVKLKLAASARIRLAAEQDGHRTAIILSLLVCWARQRPQISVKSVFIYLWSLQGLFELAASVSVSLVAEQHAEQQDRDACMLSINHQGVTKPVY